MERQTEGKKGGGDQLISWHGNGKDVIPADTLNQCPQRRWSPEDQQERG